MAEGRRLEQAGNLDAAAAAYRKLVDKDFHNQEAVGRLLMIYRKQGNYREELTAINKVLAAYREENKAREEKWMREHARAAAAGRAIYRELGGTSISGFGVDPEVTALTRRKEVVERKIGGKASKKTYPKRDRKGKAAEKRTVEAERRKREEEKRKQGVVKKKRGAAERKREAAEAKKAKREEEAARKARDEAARKARDEAARKARDEAARKAAAIKKTEEKAARKAAAEAKKYPTLFVIILRYTASLQEIDAAMKAHVAFLDRHYARGEFLVSGRQEPRTGGVILARGKNREAIEQMMKDDPFVKSGLAEVEVVEFRASQMSKGLARYLKK